MAGDSKKTKPDTAPKTGAAAKADGAATADAPKDASKDASKKDSPQAEGGASAAATPSNYSRGEGQKPVTAAYRENWNAIFANKSKKKTKR